MKRLFYPEFVTARHLFVTIFSVYVTILFSFSAAAQTEGINFQGVARNAAGEVLVNQQISLRLSILLGSESGAVAYVETRQTSTNPQGIFAVVVGDGTALSKTGNFSSIDWGTAPKFIKVEMDPTAGTNFLAMGISRMQAVSVAFHAYGVDASKVKGVLPVGSGGTGVASISELKTSLNLDQVNNTADTSKPISTATQGALNTKVDKVTGKDLSTNDYSTAEKTKLAAITGTNTGDQDLSALATNTALALKANTTDVNTALNLKLDASGNASTATKLATTKNINGVAFDGSADITVTANAGTLTGTTLASNVVNSSLTSVGTLTSGTINLTTDIATTGTLKAGNNTYPNSNGNDGEFLKTNGSGTLSWASVPSPNLSNYVTTNTAQTITEEKTFSKDLTVNGITVGRGKMADGDNKNTAVGQSALSNNTGTSNTAIGNNALLTNTSGAANTAIGASALQFNVSGGSNTAVGLDALRTNVGSQNTAVGRDALRGSGTGSTNNTAIGYNALKSTTSSGNTIGGLSGTGNTAVGSGAGSGITTGSNNITIGGDDAVGTGSNNTLVGVSAKVSGASTSNATAIGYTSKSAVQGTAIGNSASALASKATAIGNGAYVASNASNATAIGNGALIDASNATAIGNRSIVGPLASNSTAIGNGAYVANPNTIQLGADGTTTDIDNVLIPAVTDVKTSGTLTAGTVTYPNVHNSTSGQVLTINGTGTATWAAAAGGVPYTGATGAVNLGAYDLAVNGITVGRGGGNESSNTAIGINALSVNTPDTSDPYNFLGANNTATGADALKSNTTGAYNTAFGYRTLSTNIAGSYSTAIGTDALKLSTGGSNTANGAFALEKNTTGAGNTAIGTLALSGNTTGDLNTAIGFNALSVNTTGTLNTAIGNGANVASSALTNATAIGNGASVTASNTIQLGNGSVTDVRTSGNLTVNGITVGRGRLNVISNTAIGGSALSLNTTGSFNTANGYRTLSANTTGENNTASGADALKSNTTGAGNTAIGYNALSSNTADVGFPFAKGDNNTAIGNRALQSNTTGSGNIAVGVNALLNNTLGDRNTAIGSDAGRYITNGTTFNTTSDYSVYLGSNTKASADNAQNEIVIGYNAIGAGSNTIQLGSSTGSTAITNVKTSGTLTAGTVTYPNTDGSANQVLSTNGSGTLGWTSIASPDLTNYVTTNTAQTITESKTFSKDLSVNEITVGKGAGNINTNTAIGYNTLSSSVFGSTITGYENTAYGYRTLRSNITGNFNTASGSGALRQNTSGNNNTAFGYGSLFSNTTGSSNTAIGMDALQNNETGTLNTAIGYDAGVSSSNKDLTNTTAIGNGARVTESNTIQLGNTSVTDVKTSGNLTVNGITVGRGRLNVISNTAIGGSALSLNTDGSFNTAIGYRTLSANTTGYNNTATGADALTSNTTGLFNTAYGSSTLLINSTGYGNTAIGTSALINNETGTLNTAIGYDAGVSSSNKDLTNTTAIGNGARVTESNTIQLGSSTGSTAITKVNTSGTVFAFAFSPTSDLRLKSNITPLANSLATVMQLNPVHYMKKGSLASTAYTREENGFIAQEIQKILPFVVTEGTDENKLLSVDYNSFIPVLTKAIQEQQKQIEDQNAKIAAQQKQIEELIKLVKGQ